MARANQTKSKNGQDGTMQNFLLKENKRLFNVDLSLKKNSFSLIWPTALN
jgi:hypothetical protein